MECTKIENLTLEAEEQPIDAANKEPDTLYPKIRKLTDLVCQVKKSFPEAKTLHLVGTVKLHGTHADIVFEPDSEKIRLQSRNQLDLKPEKDNAGFATFVANIGARRVLDLRDRILGRYRKLNPDTEVVGEIVIAGEWCGYGIQKNVAVSDLPRFFAIISIQINGSFMLDEEYCDIFDEDSRFFHIGKAGFFRFDLNLEDVNASEEKIQNLTDAVEAECPFGKVMGVTGRGEGIVWKAADYYDKPTFWFKSKGEELAVSHSNKLPASAVARDNRERMENFARAIVTEARLEQGWENVVQKNETGIGVFLRWVSHDCYDEEKREMENLKIGKGKLGPVITSIAKPWFLARLKRQTQETVMT